MNLRPASLPPLSSKPTRPPCPPLRYFSARRFASPFWIRGMDHLGDLRAFGEPGGDRGRVGAVALDAQRQRLDALKGEEGVERRHAGAEVAQQRHARLDDVGDRPERLDRFAPHRAVIARIGRVERRLALLVLLPGKVAAVDDEAADRGAVAAEVLGRRIDDDRRAVIEGPGQDRRGGVVHDQRNAEANGRSPPPRAIGNAISFGLGSVSA